MGLEYFLLGFIVGAATGIFLLVTVMMFKTKEV